MRYKRALKAALLLGGFILLGLALREGRLAPDWLTGERRSGADRRAA